MYDLNKRSYFSTLGELRMLLASFPNETEVCTGGVLGSYLHFEKDRNLVSFDDEDLGCDYDLEYPGYYDDELYLKRQEIEDKEYDQRLRIIDEGWQVFVVGNKLMRTFLADDGSWDYELYDIKLTPIESGQLGEDRNMTREEVTREVLSWRNLEKKERTYFAPTEDFVDLCNYCYSNEKMIKEYYYGF